MKSVQIIINPGSQILLSCVQQINSNLKTGLLPFLMRESPINSDEIPNWIRNQELGNEIRVAALDENSNGIALARVARFPGRSAHVAKLSITVTKSSRRTGIGTKVFEVLLGACKKSGIQRIEALPAEDNISAITFLKSNLFVVEGIATNRIQLESESFGNCIHMARALRS